jgi:hypothetical protein
MAFMAFVGLSGNGANSALAYDDDKLEGEFCKIDGPATISVGDTALYVGRLDAPTHHDTTVSIDNIIGSSKITSVVDDEGKYKKGYYGDYNVITPNNQIQNVQDTTAFKFNKALLDLFEAKFEDSSSEIKKVNTCGPTTSAAITRLITDAIAAGEACGPSAQSASTALAASRSASSVAPATRSPRPRALAPTTTTPTSCVWATAPPSSSSSTAPARPAAATTSPTATSGLTRWTSASR